MVARADYLPVEVNLPLEEPVPHDHGAEVLGHDLDKEVEDHRLPPHLRPLAPLDAATRFITFEVDVYEDFAGVGIEKYEAGNLVCYLSEENSKVVKACRRLCGDRGWQPDVT